MASVIRLESRRSAGTGLAAVQQEIYNVPMISSAALTMRAFARCP